MNSAKWARLVFVGALVGAVPLYLVRGHEQWFFLDEWDFLTSRKLGSANDLFRPHNEHWSTLPIIVYRVLWHLVGLRSYMPYQLVLILLHLTAAILLRRIILRAGVDAWIATAAACAFVFLGSGRQNIVWAFQIGFVGSLVCGLAHLILADHDGPADGRDVYGLLVGGIGLLCSGVAVTMTIVVGVAVLLRRGWRLAALHTAPLACVYLVWFGFVGHRGYEGEQSSLAQVPRFVATGLANSFTRMGQLWGIGALLGALLGIGLVVAWARCPFEQFRRTAAVPAALLIGAVVFLAIAGYGRSLAGTSAARAPRYVHLVVAMALPALAIATDALVRRWRGLAPLLVLLLVIGIPGNVEAIELSGTARFTKGSKSLVLALPQSPYAGRVPRSLRLDQAGLGGVTVGWLLDGVRSGRIPTPSGVAPETAAAATLMLVLHQSAEPVATTACRAFPGAVTVNTDARDVFVLDGGLVEARVRLTNGSFSKPRTFPAGSGSYVLVETGGVTITFSRPNRSTAQFEMCRRA